VAGHGNPGTSGSTVEGAGAAADVGLRWRAATGWGSVAAGDLQQVTLSVVVPVGFCGFRWPRVLLGAGSGASAGCAAASVSEEVE
jgi:hypothetical protein